MRRAWLWYLVGAVVVTGVQAALPASALRDVVYCLIPASTVAAIFVGVRLYRPSRRLPWMLLALGVGSWLVGDVVWTVLIHVQGVNPFPSIADLFYLFGYPALAGGLYQMSSGRNIRQGLATLADALIGGTAIGLVLWVAFIEPSWTAAQGSLIERVVGVAYPVGDVLLLIQLFHLGATPIARSVSLRLIGLGAALSLVADVLFQAAGYVPALDANVLALDPLWLVGYAVWGVAALHPSMRRITDGPSSTSHTYTVQRMALLAVTAAVVPGTLLVEVMLGTEPHVVEALIAGVVIIGLTHVRMRAMVDRLQEQARSLAQLADTDILTGVENRRRFTRRLDEALARPSARLTLLLVGLDRWVEIHDTLGHRTADDLLRGFAERLVGAAGPDAAVARMTGGLFGVLVDRASGTDDALRRAGAIREACGEPFQLQDLAVAVEANVGVVLSPEDGTDAEELWFRAEVAVSAARDEPGRIVHYALDLATGAALAPLLVVELPHAMEEGHIVVHFQPQVEVTTGHVFGVEALVRWQHPEHGLLPPALFVPAAERTGLIRALTLYVLDRSLAQCAQWKSQGLDLAVSVNLSAHNLLDPGIVGDVRSALERHGLEARSLELEITETMAMVDPARAVEVLGELDALGVALAVDDYGTGQSSLAYLKQLPVRRLKIDRSFVQEVVTDKASGAIVHSTIELAHHLGIDVVAEGVEDDETLVALHRMGCNAAQGFRLGRPVPAAEIPALVADIEQRVPEILGLRVPTQRRV